MQLRERSKNIKHITRAASAAGVVGLLVAGLSACSGGSAAAAPKPSVKVAASVSPSPSKPPPPAMLLNTIVPEPGTTVGVAMPISVEFSKPVATSAHASIERHLKVTTSTPVTGAWHWFSSTRVDFRPKSYWPSGTKVTLDAQLKGVGDGYGRYGTHDYTHSFTIGPDVEAQVSVPGHSMKVYRNGQLVRTMPIDAGSPSWPSWDGTMAVIDKQPEVHMTSCSVGISCNPKSPNYYDLTLPWDVHLTTSGTYVHYSTGDPYPGHSVGSHGCIHLSLANAKWFYNYVEQGDPVTITGSPRGKAAGDNGYADYNLSWSQWLAGSAAGQLTTGTS
jgi:lipoprotein-anchoring transpeptidase ErfK/SrfK